MLRLCLTFFTVCVIGLFIQGGMLKGTFPSAIAPDFIVILIATIGLRFRSVLGILGAFALGLLSDFASGLYLGPGAAGAITAFLLAGVIANRVYADKGVALFLIVFFCSLAKSVVVIGMLWLYVGRIHPDHGMIVTLIIEALLSGLGAPIVVKLMFGQPSWAGKRKRNSQSALNWVIADR